MPWPACLSSGRAVEHELEYADVLRLPRGELVCRSCAACATAIHELCRDVPIGNSARIIALEDEVRVSRVSKSDFDLEAEAERVLAERAHEEQQAPD